MQFISSFGDHSSVIVLVVFAIAAWLFYLKYKKEALLLFFTLSSAVFSEALKLIFRLPRPVGADKILYNPLDIYGFPSGHAMFYTIFFGFMIYLLVMSDRMNKYMRYVGIFISAVFVSLVGVSRVYLGVHYVRDVLGGYGFGLIILGLLIYLHRSNVLENLFKMVFSGRKSAGIQ